VYGPGVLVSSWFLLLRGIFAALRQKIHLSTCPNFPGHLSTIGRNTDAFTSTECIVHLAAAGNDQN
jgi:hypothetical protein